MAASLPALILWDGATGSLGKWFAPAFPGRPIVARLEDDQGTRQDIETALRGLAANERVVFVSMAGRVPVGACELDPLGTYRINVELVAARAATFGAVARAMRLRPSIVYVSSGHVYAGAEQPLTEEAPTAPRSVYAKSKLDCESALRRLDLPVVIARVFGLIAPRQPAAYVLPALIARVREGRLDRIGGLDNVRDYLDARDVCRILVSLATAPLQGTSLFNVSSGEGVRIRDVLSTILRESGAADWAARAGALEGDAGRPGDLRVLVGDPTRIQALLGTPCRTIGLATTVRDALAAA